MNRPTTRRRTWRTWLTLSVLAAQAVLASEQARGVSQPGDLFQDTRLLDVRVTFTPEQFAALAPQRAAPGAGFFLGQEGHRNGLTAYRGIELPYVHAAAVSIDGVAFKDVGARYKGNGTFFLGQTLGKQSFKLDLNHFVPGQKLGAIKTVNLHNGVTDASYMNEVLAFRAFREAGVMAPRTAYARVWLTVPGKYDAAYYGLFSLVENPDDVFMAARGKAPGGAIFKPVTPNLFGDLGTDWARYNQIYDPKTPLTEAQKRRVMEFARVATSSTDAAFAAVVGDYLDLDACARYFAMTTWLVDLDGILGTAGQNYYLYLDARTNRFSFVAWDQDHSFGQYRGGSQRDREQLNINQPWALTTGNRRLLERLFKVEAFRSLYRRHLAESNDTVLSPARLATQVDATAALIRPAIRMESAERLNRFEQAVAGQTPPALEVFFDGTTVPIKPFAKARAESVRSQLAAR